MRAPRRRPPPRRRPRRPRGPPAANGCRRGGAGDRRPARRGSCSWLAYPPKGFTIGGNRAETSVPRPGADRIAIRPPRSSTRSRIPTRPRLVHADPRHCASATSNPAPSSRTTRSRLALGTPQLDPDVPRAGVPRDVGQRLLSHAEAGGLQLGLQAEVDADRRHVEPGGEAGDPRLVVDVGPQGRDQAEVVEERGPQVERDAADLPERPLDQGDALAEPRPHLGWVEPLAADHLEVDLDRGERLPDLVVQLPGDVVPLVLLGADQPPREVRQPDPRASTASKSCACRRAIAS